ncbi:MAG: TonB-dependent receptor [Methylobacillus glycogenes]|nr:TonB-dependent receptor [Methylobacillus glycogenes]
MLRINSLLLASSLLLANGIASAADLNTTLPSNRKEYDIPAGSLGAALNKLSQKTGKPLVYDPNITKGKNSAALKGVYSPDEAFDKLLQGTGLELVSDRQGNYELRPAPIEDKTLPALGPKSEQLRVDEVLVRGKRFYEVGPLPGLGLTKDQIPGNVQSITAKEIKETNSLSIADLLNRKLQSVTVNDYQGNPFQMDVQYRGFTAGPQIGTPQGLSVFFDGIRVNEPFGDVVNWDMIPMNAIANIDVFPGSNPIFGLNTLGGAFTIKTKDGFNNTGVDANILTGSFGRKQLQAEGGWNNGTVAGFAAANIFLEDGWRDNSPSKVNQVFGKGSYRGDKLDLNLTGLVAWNDLVGNGLIPNEMYQQNRNGVFTSPDNTDNRLWQGQLSGSYFVNDNFTITGQVYRRISKRKNVNSDVYTEYGNTPGTKNIEAGDQITCLYTSNNSYGLPDYYLVRQPHNLAAIYADVEAVAFGADPADHPLFDVYQNDPEVQFVVNGMAGFGADVSLLPADALNKALPDYYVAYAQYQFNYNKNQRVALAYVSQAGAPGAPPSTPPIINGAQAYTAFLQGIVAAPGLTEPIDFNSGNANYYLSDNGNGTYDKYVLIYKTATNSQACGQAIAKYPANPLGGLQATDPVTGAPLFYDGSSRGAPGMVEGVPTALITETEINQFVNGASVQFNWNFDKHKFMVGAAIDSARADYGSGQRLGFFDAKRHAYLDPAQALDAITAADREVRSNDFDGTSVTRSLYLSETWSPVEQFHLTGALRYNATKVKNTLAAREFGSVVIGLHNFTSEPDAFNICNPGDPCITGYKVPDLSRVLNAAETEKFSYYSLNPSIGANWQATPEVNVFGNIAQGTRTPSVIELGCALDKTLVNIGEFIDQDGDGQLDPTYAYKSVAENRSCSLPNTLSGDPYLPQIKATTFDVGMKGSWGNNMVWNLGLYRTDLKDDIYMVTLPGNRSFFDTIGKTRRQGFEAGLSGKLGKATFHLNYSLTDATFQDTFLMASDHNSSATENLFFGTTEAGEAPPKAITVKPGNRMPGVALHNINASVSYEVTDKWSVGLSTVVHSESYIRGNENNQHRPGAIKYVTFADIDPATGISRGDITEARPASNNPGKLPGYATVNFHTKYQFTPEWSASLMVVNILDKEYYTAGRLGVNPFSPSIRGAIGPDGYNHNSYDWLDTTFLSPGAPRAAWFTLRYEFRPQ